MYSIFGHAFPIENPKLSQLMYAGRCPHPVFTHIVKTQLQSEYSKFRIAFDCRRDFDEDMAYGWIVLGIVPDGNKLDLYASTDFSVYLSWRMLSTEARDRGEDPNRLCTNDLRVQLADAIDNRSRDGQFNFVPGPHLVVNSLVLWPNSHSDSKWEMAFKLLGWAVNCSKRQKWPIWTQIPVGQLGFFRQAGFTEVSRFVLNLNHYATSRGTDWGTQEWVQMVYRALPERRARSISPELRGGRQRRPSF